MSKDSTSDQVSSIKNDINTLTKNSEKTSKELKHINEELTSNIQTLENNIKKTEKDLETIKINVQKQSIKQSTLSRIANKTSINIINISLFSILILPCIILIVMACIKVFPSSPQWIRSVGLFSLDNLASFSNFLFQLIKFITTPIIIFLMLFSIEKTTLKWSTFLFWAYLLLIIILTFIFVKTDYEFIQFFAKDLISPLLVGLFFYNIRKKL